MLNLLFNLKNPFNTFPNEVKMVNDDYIFSNSNICFGDLSKMNVFIGENNCGKSRFLRNLFAKPFYGLDYQSLSEFFGSYEEKIYYAPYDEIPKSNVKRFEKLYKAMTDTRNSYSFTETTFFDRLQRNSKNVSNSLKFYFPVVRGSKNYKQVIEDKLNSFVSDSKIKDTDSIMHYIDLLSLKDVGLNSLDLYKQIIKQEYFNNVNDLGSILTGGSLYNEIKSKLLGEENDRKLIEGFQDFLREQFFEEYDKVQLIPNEKERCLWVKIGKNENAIYDLGDGTQQLIIMLYSLFKHKEQKGCLFFIEEPEMYLHPGILRKFIEVLNSEEFVNHQYFITTHSNVVLDVSAEVDVNMSIFKFKKITTKKKKQDPSFIIEQCNNGDVSLLNDLGIRNSSVFLSNCSIWVEGITDRLYLKHYLKLYQKKYNEKTYREGIDYTFIEYGGANVVHFNFDKQDLDNEINAKYISNKVFLIADNDNTLSGEAKHERKEHFKNVLEENFYELPVTEMENLVSNHILKEFLKNKNEKQKEIIEERFKNNESYAYTHLGEYIDKLFEDVEMKRYAATSGTIKDKLKFCLAIIELTTDYDFLSEEAKQLTEKIYNFIKSNN